MMPPALALPWEAVEATPAFKALQKSCITRPDHSPLLCPHIARLHSGEELKDFLRQHFTPEIISDDALLTAYYQPVLEGSLTPSAEYPYPVWGVPANFTTPYLTRQQIDQGALAQKGEMPLLWVKSRVDLFFLHVQGSGLVELPDGTRRGLQFAAKNEQPYASIGKLLIAEGEISKADMSLQSLKRWLNQHPAQQDRILWQNPSYIFFQLAKNDSAIGGAGLALTPRGSVAVDPKVTPYGSLMLIETTLPQENTPRYLLTLAQDTGSAITGAGRADWFLGYGSGVEALAGEMKQPARFWHLTPKQ